MWKPATTLKNGAKPKSHKSRKINNHFLKCGVSTIITDEIWMKKLLMALVLFVGFSVIGYAQPVTKSAKKTDNKTKVVSATKPAATAKVAKMPKTVAKTTASTAAKPADEKKKSAASNVVLKKDGTPDKRYKNNAAAGPLKKDGTPDMRYKNNKTEKK